MTVVYQGFHPSSDSFLSDATMAKLKVPHPFDVAPDALNLIDRSWSSIQSLYISPFSHKECPKHTPSYPVAKFEHGGISFDMCTETLGDENGTDFCNSNTLFLFSSVAGGAGIEEVSMCISNTGGDYVKMERQKARRKKQANGGACNFPPPLTSMSGSNSIQISPRRENGKLVMEAVHCPENIINVERSEGRLRLNMVEDHPTTDTVARVESGNDSARDNEWEEDWHSHATARSESDIAESDGDDDVEVDMAEIGLEEYRRPTRCKDGELENPINWQRFWVAT